MMNRHSWQNTAHHNGTGKVGLVGYWDTIAFDEFAGKKKRVDKALVDIMKNYMANKTFSRGIETLGAEASMVFVGNTQHSVPHMLKHSDLFNELPESYHDKNLIYEAWSWVEYGLSHCSLETLTTIAQRLADWTLQAESHPVAYILAEVPPYRVLIQPFSAHQVSFLTIEPINPYDNSTKRVWCYCRTD